LRSCRVRFILILLFTLGTLHAAESGITPSLDHNSSGLQTAKADAVDDDDAYAEEFEAEEFGDDDFGDEDFESEFTAEKKTEVFDPLSGYNRVMTGFNDGLYIFILKPVVFKGYNYIPEPVRVSVNNFFNNLYYPVSVANNILQLKAEHTGTETLRFLINSTLGVLGLFDPAKSWFGLEEHVEDFGQTLGYYGVGSGFHIVLPFFGPTNLRDLSGDFIDFYVNPIYYVDVRPYNIFANKYQGWGAISYKKLNKMSLYTNEYENVRKDALDLYPFMRDLYEQHRQKEIEE